MAEPSPKKQRVGETPPAHPAPAPAPFTALPALRGMVAELQAVPQHTIPLADRKHIIGRIRACLVERAADFRAAEFADLRRPAGFHDRIRGGCVGTCDYYLQHLDRLAADTPCDAVPAPAPGSRARRSYVRHEPRGLALVIGTWNFPLPLHIKPLVTAIAAGCPALLKCNDQCVATSAVMLRVLGAEYLAADDVCRKYVKVALGKRDLVHEALRSHWGMVFFTGGEAAAKHICRAAADTLSPVCMELGGKNPVYITRHANLETAVLKLVDAKFQNAGQFCVSPDHVHLDAAIPGGVARFEALLRGAVARFFGDDPQRSPHYSRVINAAHHARLVSYADAADHGGRDLLAGAFPGGGGGAADAADLYVPRRPLRAA
jgi:acyl-CoA reductase-like NAD-dependent aldehyde dehydrogenase